MNNALSLVSIVKLWLFIIVESVPGLAVIKFHDFAPFCYEDFNENGMSSSIRGIKMAERQQFLAMNKLQYGAVALRRSHLPILPIFKIGLSD
mgnify:CR=1 FL=1